MGRFVGAVLALVALGVALTLAVGPSVSSRDNAKAFDPSRLAEIQERILSGFASFELAPPDAGGNNGSSRGHSTYNPRGSDACPQ
jgi:hypothetical protein